MIDILMTVFNAEKYINEQIQSIINQTNSNWMLYIQDDCSTDDTVKILQKYVSKYPERIILNQNNKNSGSAFKNFFSMLKYTKHEYVMFCDHDDVWEPQKIEVTYRKMLSMEAASYSNTPLLVHTDLKVVDDELNVINKSMVKMQNINPNSDKLNRLLVQNVVTGCTMMINRPLIDLVKETPEYCIMHDWWFALIACCFGFIGFLNKPTILYRQHDSNEVGAKDASNLHYNMNRLADKQNANEVLTQTYLQAMEFKNTYKEYLSKKQFKILDVYSNIPNLSKFNKIKTLFRYKFLKHGFFRKLGQILFV